VVRRWYALASTWTTESSDRSLLLALPALATLAAFALPTLKRSVAALIDWFTLLFFTACAVLGIWVVLDRHADRRAAQPAANVGAPGARLRAQFLGHRRRRWPLVATLAWAWLVKWRAGPPPRRALEEPGACPRAAPRCAGCC
jgi:hypothetical protein